MEDKEEVNGTEQTSSVENKPNKVESKEMVEENSELKEQVVNTEIGTEEAKEIPTENTTDKNEVANEEPLIEDSEKEEKEPVVEDKQDAAKPVKEENKKEEVNTDSEEVTASKEEVAEPVVDNKEESAEQEDDSKEDDHHHPHEDELANEDFTKYSKEAFVELVKTLAKHENPLYADRYLKKIEPLFEEIRKAEIKSAKDAYIKENENAEGFSFNADELINRFDANTRLIQDKKYHFIKEREAVRKENLVKAEAALEHLREFVDSEESSASFNKFKEIQNEWKAIGDVPGQYSKTLWANYNALIHRFYDQRSIYFELKELDRKKNYETKVKLCERAEELGEFDNLKEAINTLNDLHHEYKHLGPVPQELQEDLWIRFKAASDKVYQKRKEFVSDLKVVLNENLLKKEELVTSIKLFTEFDSDRIKEWNIKTKEILELQKKWEAIGGLPREKSKDVNKNFWSSFKLFFHNKGNFFKKLDEERKGNYEAKMALVEKAEALKASTDWFKTANDFKALQKEWKTIGPVPEKLRNQAYNKFKEACDFFFNNKRTNSKDEESSFRENLKLKKEIIAQIEEWASKADDNLEAFKGKVKEFSTAGFVPRKDINSVKENYAKSVDKFINSLSADDEVKNTLRVEIELGDILGSKNSERVLYNKEQNIRRQVQQLEDDVSLWKNNLEFFAHSKNADGLRKEVNEKIDKAEAKVESLKGQLRILRKV